MPVRPLEEPAVDSVLLPLAEPEGVVASATTVSSLERRVLLPADAVPLPDVAGDPPALAIDEPCDSRASELDVLPGAPYGDEALGAVEAVVGGV